MVGSLQSTGQATDETLRHVVVTGGAGFIGSHIVERLVALGACVTVVDDFSTGRRENLDAVRGDIEMVDTDVSQAIALRLVPLESCDAVVHCAANPYVPWSVEDPRCDFDLNVRTTFDLLEALRGLPARPRLLNFSSAAVYGNPATMPICEADPCVPISPYGVSKLAAENYARVYSECYGLRTTSLRLFSAYGPRQRKQLVFDLIRKCEATPRRIEVYGDGSQQRDLVYVADIAEAVVVALERAPARGEAYNVATGTSHTVAGVVDAVCTACDVKPEIAYTGAVRTGDAERWSADTSRLAALGFRANTTLEAGVALVRDWYRNAAARPAARH